MEILFCPPHCHIKNCQHIRLHIEIHGYDINVKIQCNQTELFDRGVSSTLSLIFFLVFCHKDMFLHAMVFDKFMLLF